MRKVKKVWAILASICLLICLEACGIQRSAGQESKAAFSSQAADSSEGTASEAASAVSEPISLVTESSADGSQDADTAYQSILDEYSAKIREAVPALIEEYNAEAQNNTEGIQGLAELSNAKISELAKISNEGVQEMAKIYFKMGSGEYSEYEEWAQKLMDIYMEEAQKITDAYMDSAM